MELDLYVGISQISAIFAEHGLEKEDTNLGRADGQRLGLLAQPRRSTGTW